MRCSQCDDEGIELAVYDLRAANARFAAALDSRRSRRGGEAPTTTSGRDVAVRACAKVPCCQACSSGHECAAGSERARFGSLAGRASVADDERIIELCAEGRADEAGAAARENWSTLGRLLNLDDDDESTADAQAPA